MRIEMILLLVVFPGIPGLQESLTVEPGDSFSYSHLPAVSAVATTADTTVGVRKLKDKS